MLSFLFFCVFTWDMFFPIDNQASIPHDHIFWLTGVLKRSLRSWRDSGASDIYRRSFHIFPRKEIKLDSSPIPSRLRSQNKSTRARNLASYVGYALELSFTTRNWTKTLVWFFKKQTDLTSPYKIDRYFTNHGSCFTFHGKSAMWPDMKRAEIEFTLHLYSCNFNSLLSKVFQWIVSVVKTFAPANFQHPTESTRNLGDLIF